MAYRHCAPPDRNYLQSRFEVSRVSEARPGAPSFQRLSDVGTRVPPGLKPTSIMRALCGGENYTPASRNRSPGTPANPLLPPQRQGPVAGDPGLPPDRVLQSNKTPRDVGYSEMQVLRLRLAQRAHQTSLRMTASSIHGNEWSSS